MIPRIVVGGLSQRGVIQTHTSTPDGAGGSVKSWSNTATVWMRIQPLAGQEQLAGMQIQDKVSHKITMRYRALTTAQRILHKGIAYNIRAILDEEGRERKLTVMCEQGVAT